MQDLQRPWHAIHFPGDSGVVVKPYGHSGTHCDALRTMSKAQDEHSSIAFSQVLQFELQCSHTPSISIDVPSGHVLAQVPL